METEESCSRDMCTCGHSKKSHYPVETGHKCSFCDCTYFTFTLPEENTFTVKDSGEREAFDSGMVRDVTKGKTDYSLVFDGPMFNRWADHLTKGAVKYNKRNWMKASGQEELDRFRESAIRHFIEWLDELTDEDHAAAVLFNINGYEYTKGVINGKNV